MNLQTYAKIGISTGIGAVVISVIFLGVIMAGQIQNEYLALFVDKDKILTKMKATESFVLLNEKYPETYFTERSHRNNIEIEAFAYNFDTGNRLRLSLNYDPWEERIREYVRCDIEDGKLRQHLGIAQEFQSSELQYPRILFTEGRAEDNFAADFIKYTNCLEMDIEEELIQKVSEPKYGEIPTYTISVPQGSSVPGCEEIAHCFEPEEITIKAGQIIEWKNYDDAMHTITSGGPEDGPTGLFDSGLAEPDATYALKFETAGDYQYFCMVHPWQTGTITVTE